MKHTIVARVDNRPGVVSRISGLFTRRGYNIESFVTSVTENADIYHLTISVIGSEHEVSLLVSQLGRFIDVIEVYETENSPHVTREFMLIKVKSCMENRPELLKIADILKCKTVGIGDEVIIFEITGDSGKLDSIVRSFEPYGILEIVRSGAISIKV